MTITKKIWIVSYGFGSGCLVHNEGFKSEKKAREFYEKMKDCPYCEIYQTDDIWS